MWTKEERAEYMKKYQREHKDEINANHRLYYKKHKEKRREATKRWIENNREKWNAYQRAYKRKREERIKELLCQATLTETK